MNGLRTAIDSLDAKGADDLKPLGPVRSTAAAVILALGLGVSLSQVIPTETHADKSKNNAAKMAQNGAGY